MFDSQGHRKLWLVAAAAGLLTIAGCSNQATTEPVHAAKKVEPKKPAPVVNKEKAPQPTAMVTVPKGTAINATVGQTLASNKNHVGDTFAGSLSAPVKVAGKTVIPKGTHVTGRVVTVKKKELKVALASVELHGKSYQLETNSVANPAKSPAKAETKNVKATTQKDKKDVTTLPAKSQLTFKLAKAVSIPAKG